MSIVADPTRSLVPLIKLTAYKKIQRTRADKIGSLLLPYDNKNMSNKYQNNFSKTDCIGSESGGAEFMGAKDSKQSITFVLDDSTYSNLVAFFMPPSLIPDSVDKIIKKLIKYTHSIAGDLHEPYFLRLTALNMPFSKGAGSFDCRLSCMSIENKNINLKGGRTKAHVNCEFVECLSQAEINARTKRSSPDLSHTRQVVAGETLTGNTYDIYEDPTLAVSVAEFNQLDSLRELPVGEMLTYPPIARSSD